MKSDHVEIAHSTWADQFQYFKWFNLFSVSSMQVIWVPTFKVWRLKVEDRDLDVDYNVVYWTIFPSNNGLGRIPNSSAPKSLLSGSHPAWFLICLLPWVGGWFYMFLVRDMAWSWIHQGPDKYGCKMPNWSMWSAKQSHKSLWISLKFKETAIKLGKGQAHKSELKYQPPPRVICML